MALLESIRRNEKCRLAPFAYTCNRERMNYVYVFGYFKFPVYIYTLYFRHKFVSRTIFFFLGHT